MKYSHNNRYIKHAQAKDVRQYCAYIMGLFAIVLFASASVRADHKTDIDIRELVREAEFVFEGTVTNIEYKNSEALPRLDPITREPMFDPNGNPLYEDGSNIPHTFVTYQIDTIHEGRAPPAFPGGPPAGNVILRFLGGQSQSDTSEFLILFGAPLFDPNDRDFLFVKGNTETNCPLYECANGRFRIITDPCGTNKIYTEYGEEVLFVPGGAAPSSVALGPFHSLVEIETHDMGEFILKTVSADGDNDSDFPDANDVPEVGVPKGDQFTEAEFGTYIDLIVREVCGAVPPADCGSEVVSADPNQTFTAIPFPVAEPNFVVPAAVPHDRPWLDDLPPEEKAEILETERREQQLMKLTHDNPVLPSTPCEVSILTYGAMVGDVSGPDGKPDCEVNLYDVVAMGNNWLKAGLSFPIVPFCQE